MAQNDDQYARSSCSREEEVDLKPMRNSRSSERPRSRIPTSSVKEEAAKDDYKPLDSIPPKLSTQSSTKASRSPDGSHASISEEIVGGEVVVKMEPGQPPKLARSSSQKIPSRPAQNFNDHVSKTEESKSVFEVIPACVYSNKHMGATEHGMDCDCSEEWGKAVYIFNFVYHFLEYSNLIYTDR